MKVAIIEDQELFAKGLRAILLELENVDEISCYYTGEDALAKICDFKPDIIFLDLNLPDCTGIDIIKELRTRNSKAIISILSMYKDNTVIAHSEKMGANAYLSKDADIEELKHVLNINIKKEKFYTGKDLIEKEDNIDETLEKRINITNREKEILKHIIDGDNPDLISDKLNISHHTVKSHIKNIKKKFNVSTTTELLSYVFRNKIILM